MARRCCKDSVAMWAIAHDQEPTEGLIVPCRWCTGYGRYEGGRWAYGEDETEARRHTTVADSVIPSPEYQARKSDVLGTKKS